MSIPPSLQQGEDRAYHLHRLQQEQLRAEQAADPGVRHVHLRMAEAYARLVDAAPATQAAG
jgi:hypothetical protein